MPPRYPPRTANPNRITLDLDPITSDLLKAVAHAKQIDRTRCAYELLQAALGMRTELPLAHSGPAEPDSHITFNWRQHTTPETKI